MYAVNSSNNTLINVVPIQVVQARPTCHSNCYYFKEQFAKRYFLLHNCYLIRMQILAPKTRT